MSVTRCSLTVQWCWSANDDSCASNAEWFAYTDIDNQLIENAFNENKDEIEIDGGDRIDLKEQVHYHQLGSHTKRAIKRVALDRTTAARLRLREDRFSSPVSLAPTSPAEIIEEAKKKNIRVQLLRDSVHFPASYLWFLTSPKTTFAEIVEEAIQGILQEGIECNKRCEAELLAGELRAVKHHGEGIDRLDDAGIPDEIGRTCVFLYTRDSFLFRMVNLVLRDMQNITQERLKRWGPFSALLAFYLEQVQTSSIETVYRGLNCSDEERAKFMGPYVIHFSAFTSTSTNRALVSIFGNTLLIIQPNFYSQFSRSIRSYGVDVRSLSNFTQEEEFLIYPAALFEFVKYGFDHDRNQHLIYLKAFDSGTL